MQPARIDAPLVPVAHVDRDRPVLTQLAYVLIEWPGIRGPQQHERIAIDRVAFEIAFERCIVDLDSLNLGGPTAVP